MTPEERLQRLEATVAFQDRTISDLNEIVTQFARRVERLESELKRVQDRAQEPEIGPHHDPPPHY
jgi:SlyX protein